MKTAIDDRLRHEARRFALRFACEDCAHFDSDRERCSLQYAAAPRRSALQGDAGPSAHPERCALELCKTFELA